MSDRTPAGDLDAALPSHPHTTELGPLITETVVRATLSDEENALTRDHHLGSDEPRHEDGDPDRSHEPAVPVQGSKIP